MHRKTHSDPRPRLGRELKKEFAVYFQAVELFFSRFFGKYRIPVYAAMLICILFSAVLAFTVMRIEKAKPLPSLTTGTGSVQNGFSEIMQTGQALQEVLGLQNQINTLLQKDSLTASDSVAVKTALRRLEIIHHQLNPTSINK